MNNNNHIFKKNFNNLKKELNNIKKKGGKISIISHINPDGDAIGSSLAMFLYLKKINQEVCIIFPTNYPEFFK